MEVWKKIEGFDNYSVSNYGEVKRNECVIINKKGTSCKYPEKILNQENNRGYKRVTLSHKNNIKRFLVHRLVAFAFLQKEECKNFVNHIDGNKSNNSILNLEWCNSSENEKHSYNILGKVNPIRKLKNEDVNFIRQNHIKGKNGNIRELSLKYNVDISTIYNIINNKYYV